MSDYSDNMNAVRRLRAAAELLAKLPSQMAEFYANGGAGVSNPVVDDRFKGSGNARFAPLSIPYALRKSGASKSLNEHQRNTYGRGRKLIKFEGIGSSLPILVRTGKMRAAVSFSKAHKIVQTGDTAYVTFRGLPEYAVYHQEGTPNMPKRSPVDPNQSDIARVKELAERRLNAYLSAGSPVTAFGGGIARII